MIVNKVYLGSVFILLILVLFLVFTLFKVKYYTNDLDKILNQITVEIERKKDSIAILEAEFSYLSSPARISYLAKKYLNMQPILAYQVRNNETVENNVFARK